MALSKKHKHVESLFLGLHPRHRHHTVYVALCKAAKVREEAYRARVELAQMFGGGSGAAAKRRRGVQTEDFTEEIDE